MNLEELQNKYAKYALRILNKAHVLKRQLTHAESKGTAYYQAAATGKMVSTSMETASTVPRQLSATSVARPLEAAC